MKIIRLINGEPMEINLTDEEIVKAGKEAMLSNYASAIRESLQRKIAETEKIAIKGENAMPLATDAHVTSSENLYRQMWEVADELAVYIQPAVDNKHISFAEAVEWVISTCLEDPQGLLSIDDAYEMLKKAVCGDTLLEKALDRVQTIYHYLESWMLGHISKEDCYPVYFEELGYSHDEAEGLCAE